MEERAKCKHAVICGFIGRLKELINNWILWWFLIIITFGIYMLVVKRRFKQWITANTVFEDTEII